VVTQSVSCTVGGNGAIRYSDARELVDSGNARRSLRYIPLGSEKRYEGSDSSAGSISPGANPNAHGK
jgi:hypothetical protein